MDVEDLLQINIAILADKQEALDKEATMTTETNVRAWQHIVDSLQAIIDNKKK